MDLGEKLPVIDLASAGRGEGLEQVAQQLDGACRTAGFFYLVGHQVSDDLQRRLERLSRQFFEQDMETKLAIRMELGGPAWRGYFPVGNELTAGRPDQKEGLYFGRELPDEDPRVQAGLPLHGSNLFPAIRGFRTTVLEYLLALTELGHVLMRCLSVALGQDETYFQRHYTYDPTILFRIFHYPSLDSDARDGGMWSVGEHTDYGLLTILKQDAVGGLEVYSGTGWLPVPYVPGSFICNLGDMLERMTAGRYRSTAHRVRNTSDRSRYSFPFFFDPAFDAEVQPLFQEDPGPATRRRWDGLELRDLRGTYGQYLVRKVSQVFPELRRRTGVE